MTSLIGADVEPVARSKLPMVRDIRVVVAGWVPLTVHRSLSRPPIIQASRRVFGRLAAWHHRTLPLLSCRPRLASYRACPFSKSGTRCAPGRPALHLASRLVPIQSLLLLVACLPLRHLA